MHVWKLDEEHLNLVVYGLYKLFLPIFPGHVCLLFHHPIVDRPRFNYLHQLAFQCVFLFSSFLTLLLRIELADGWSERCVCYIFVLLRRVCVCLVLFYFHGHGYACLRLFLYFDSIESNRIRSSMVNCCLGRFLCLSGRERYLRISATDGSNRM